MRKIVYWSRAPADDAARARAESTVKDLRDSASRTDLAVEDWSHLEGDAGFFDALDAMQFDDLRAGVIVVFDRCTPADFEFSSTALFDVRAEGLEQDRVKRGAATTLILRYPSVWPIFVNAGDADSALNTEGLIKRLLRGFEQVVPKGEGGRPAMNPATVNDFVEFAMSQHFVTDAVLSRAAQAQSLPEQFHAPALGAQAIFDPTGLRTMTKARLLFKMLLLKASEVTVAPEEGERVATERAIATLLERLRNPAVVVEEEDELAYLAAYSAFRHGRRVWTVTNYKFFRDGVWRSDNAWADPETGGSALVLRDYDVRYVDLQANEEKVDLRNIADWRCGAKEGSAIDTWIDHAWWRTCSSFASVRTLAKASALGELNDFDVHWRLGIALRKEHKAKRDPSLYLQAHKVAASDQRRAVDDQLRLIGAVKPVSNALFVTSELEDPLLPPSATPQKRTLSMLASAYRTLLARWTLREIVSGSGSRHAPPPVNLEIASSLIYRLRAFRAEGDPRASIHAGIMAQEAYEVLMGKSPSTSMEALQQIYLSETHLEATGMALSSRIDLWPKRQDIAFTLNNSFGKGTTDDLNKEQDYASKTWSGVRTIFRASDMFLAANEANINVLTNQRWFGVREAFGGAWRRVTAPFAWLSSLFRGRRASRARAVEAPRIDQTVWRRKRQVRLLVPRRTPMTENIKRGLAGVATDPGQWAKGFFLFWVLSFVTKISLDFLNGLVTKDRPPTLSEAALFLREPGNLLLVALSSQFTDMPDGRLELVFVGFQILFLAINTLFMAFLIAMIVRQVTRD